LHLSFVFEIELKRHFAWSRIVGTRSDLYRSAPAGGVTLVLIRVRFLFQLRKSVLEDALKTIRHKSADDFCDVQIKQERISPTFEDDEDGVHVEFDFDILAELKKESDTDQDQSDGPFVHFLM
jgi:hypothetical protein